MTKTKTSTQKPSTHSSPDLTALFIALGIVVGVIAIGIAFLLHFSDKIVIDPCASPCGDQTWSEDYACPDVCVEVTLHDYLFGRK